MASIRENKKNGKAVSYSFTAYVGQDDSGEYLRKYKTWKVPDGVGSSSFLRNGTDRSLQHLRYAQAHT